MLGRKCLTVLAFAVLAISAASQDLMGNIIPNTVLIGHVFMTLSASDMFSCGHKCLERSECESFNFGAESSKSGVCELNRGVLDDQRLNSFLLKKNGFVFVSSRRFTQVRYFNHLKICPLVYVQKGELLGNYRNTMV